MITPSGTDQPEPTREPTDPDHTLVTQNYALRPHVIDATITLAGRPTAIKIKRQPDTEEARREADILFRLQHSPYAARYFGWSSEPHGTLNVGMERLSIDLYDLHAAYGLVDASDHHSPVPKRRLSLNTCCRLGAQCLMALADLHTLGFVHGDVKPSNFMLTDVGSNGDDVVRLIDFGLSRPISATPTFIGSLVGTPRYASPYVHRRMEPGIKDDLISLFYTVCEMYLGRLPWQSLERKNDGFKEMLMMKESTAYGMEGLARRRLPAPMLKYVSYVLKLGCGQRPNYECLKECFVHCIKGIDDDVYEWIEK